jgi:hypothetical protein
MWGEGARPVGRPRRHAMATPSAATDDLPQRVEAAWRTLAFCRPLVDEEVAGAVTEAMACLDEIVTLARALTVEQRRPWLDDLQEIEEMARAIYEHLLDTGRAGGSA